MEHIERVTKMFLRRDVDEDVLTEARWNGFERYELVKSAGVRKSPLVYELPIDRARLRDIHRAVSASPLAGKRLGAEWTPREMKPLRQVQQDEAWVSSAELGAFNDACTNFCTYHYFPRAFSRVTMVLNVIKLFEAYHRENGIEHTGIIFKGGVVIRLILLEFLQGLQMDGRIHGHRFLKEEGALNVSDFDFEITRDDGFEGDTASTCRAMLGHFAVLLWLMRIMALETRVREKGKRSAHLMDTKWTADAEVRENLRKTMQGVADALPREHPLHGARIDAVFPTDDVPVEEYARLSKHRSKDGDWRPRRRESFSTFRCGEERCVMKAQDLFDHIGLDGVANEYASPFYATHNMHIAEETFGQREYAEMKSSLFHLTRIKHAFVMYYTIGAARRCDRLGGEMIDLSMTDLRDEFRRFMYDETERLALMGLYRRYPVLGVPDVGIKSYGTLGFYLDLQKMLHFERLRAFEANKSTKRLLRYCCFLYLLVLGPYTPGTKDDKIAALKALCDASGRVEVFLGGSALRTGVQLIDEFVARERRTLRSMTDRPDAPRRIAAYVNTLHQHFTGLFRIVVAEGEDEDRVLLSEIVNLRRHTRK